MPNRAEHLTTSLANERLASQLADIREYGWSITCLFYSALHLIEAYLLERGVPTGNHGERTARIRQQPRLATIQRRYLVLKHESENARYECRQFNAGENSHLHDSIYTPLATYMRNLLGVS